MTADGAGAEAFEAHRRRLFGLAYRMLGEAAEAQDVVQDAYLRWARSGPVEAPAAWLTRVATNLCLNRLTSARARRERYVGPWLPEPVFSERGEPGPLETVEQRDSVSVGVLVLLERFTPAQRAVFVLREAFGYPHSEIADVLEIDEAHVRQMYRRAREQVRRPGRRFTADPGDRAELVRRFLAAALEGEVAGLERFLAADQRPHGHRVTELIGVAPVAFVPGRVTALDPARHRVELADGTSLRYDTLVYALGSQAAEQGVPGVAEHAYPVALAEDAARLRERLAHGGTVTVVGGGLTGRETVTELAERAGPGPRLRVCLLTEGALGAELSARGRRHLRRVFARLGIAVREGTRVTRVRPDALALDDGAHLPTDTVVWTAGFRAPDLARRAGFAVDAHERVIVDRTLRSLSHPDVYAIGDTAAVQHHPHGKELRMACATAIPAAAHLARVTDARLSDREPGGLRFRYVNQCISLGRRDALVQFVRADDRPVEAILKGGFAALYKEAIVRGALAAQRHPTLIRLFPGGTEPRPTAESTTARSTTARSTTGRNTTGS